LIRDRTFVSQKYEKIWGDIRDFAVGLCNGGNVDFETAYHRVLQFSNGTAAGDMCAPLPPGPAPFVIHGREVQLAPLALEYVWRDLVAHEVFRATRTDADVVVEFGSGWSPNIFNLWLRGAPRAASYFGGELTEGGRQAAEALAALRPAMRFAAPAFDWSYPDFSFIPQEARHVTLYSCFSIEQIPQLDAGVLRELLARTSAAQSVHGVFIEPVGWQFPEYAPDAAITARQRQYTGERNYNTNLRQVMETLGAERRIEVLELAVDSVGAAVNPGTVIHWQRT
jgi:hypothetical protein